MNKKSKVKVTFCGKSSEDVTNSMYLVEFNDKKILLDCGLYQSTSDNLIKTYKINHRNYKIPFKSLDAIIIGHSHTDHLGTVPLAYSKGAICPVYMPKNSAILSEIMWRDSLKIFESDCEKLQRCFDFNASLLYDEDDINNALSHIVEVDFNTEIVISDDCKFTYYHAGHIVNAAQIHLSMMVDNVLKTLLYTGDIGSDIEKDYIYPYSPTPYSDIVIGETTYAGDKRNHSQKDKNNDIEKIKSVIQQSCIDNPNKVLFGVFSLDRLQNVLTELYKIYGEDETFAIPIIIDAPLGISISKIYSELVEKNSELWEKVFSWKNIVLCNDYETSKYYQNLKTPQIILSTSNFLKAGRIVQWLKILLPNEKNHICFCGYTGDEDSLAWKIKNNKRYVEIERERIKNKANITCLTSFSSHASQQELIDRYTKLNYQKIYLVHGEFDSKCLFAEKLKDSLSKANKTSKVYTPVMTDAVTF